MIVELKYAGLTVPVSGVVLNAFATKPGGLRGGSPLLTVGGKRIRGDFELTVRQEIEPLRGLGSLDVEFSESSMTVWA